MFDRVQQNRMDLQAIAKEFDPDVLDPQMAINLVDEFSIIEKVASAVKALAAKRVKSSGAWSIEGDRSPAHWIARHTGTSVGNGVKVLETAERAAELPAVDQAMREGKLSEVQASEIASAAAASPSFETDLLKAAETQSVAELKEQCAKVKAAAIPDEMERHEKIHKGRYFRTWSGHDGAFCLEGKLTPEAGAVVLNALDPIKEKIFEKARKAGLRESYDAYAADALVSMAEHTRGCTSAPRRSGPSAMMHIRVDHSALVRGKTVDGETCELPGIGPIPVEVAKGLANDAYISGIVTDGVDIKAIAHLGRYIPARLRTALENRDPVCVVPGCGERNRLEIDHIKPVEEKGQTCLSNLARLCHWHHYLKTHHKHRLSGGPGAWRWYVPEKIKALR